MDMNACNITERKLIFIIKYEKHSIHFCIYIIQKSSTLRTKRTTTERYNFYCKQQHKFDSFACEF